MADGDREARLISQLLEFPFPQAHARAIASSPIRTDQQSLRLGILRSPDLVPPASDAFHSKSGGIVIYPDIDPACILPQIVDPVGSCSPQPCDGEVIDTYLLRLTLGTPFAPWILEIAHQFLLLGIHRNHWLPGCQKRF